MTAGSKRARTYDKFGGESFNFVSSDKNLAGVTTRKIVHGKF